MYHQKSLFIVKGRLHTSKYNCENNKRHFVTDIVAEKGTFLTTAKIKEEVEKKQF